MLGRVSRLLVLAAALCALAGATTAHAATINNPNGGAVTINDNTTATPYPSTLSVTGGDGPITDIAVSVTLTHDNINDVDLALVSPSGAATILMSDACGTGTMSTRTLSFSTSASTALPQNGPCPGSTYIASNYPPADNFPAPGPGNLSIANMNQFIGSSPNGEWQLFALDDSSFSAGSIVGWTLVITTSTAEIVVPSLGNTQGIANTYPSEKTFATPSGQVIDDLNLKINGFNHTFPRDVDLLLQGPAGQAVMVMSDACGGGSANNIADARFWTIDDEAAAPFGETKATCANNGSFKPTDLEPGDDLPAPAPPHPYGTALSAFDGLPGGAFRLFAVDDAGGDIGYIEGWSVQMTARPIAATGFAATAVPTAEGQTAQLTVSRDASVNLGAATVDVSVTDQDTDARDFGHALPTQLQFAQGEASKTIDIPINPDLEGEGAEKFFVQLSNATGDAQLSNATSIATVTIAASEADNSFSLGKVVRKRNGTAVIPVTVPGPGQLTSDDGGNDDLLKTVEAFPNGAGTTMLKVKPNKTAKRILRHGQRVHVTAKITYKPAGGSKNSTEKSLNLKRKRH